MTICFATFKSPSASLRNIQDAAAPSFADCKQYLTPYLASHRSQKWAMSTAWLPVAVRVGRLLWVWGVSSASSSKSFSESACACAVAGLFTVLLMSPSSVPVGQGLASLWDRVSCRFRTGFISRKSVPVGQGFGGDNNLPHCGPSASAAGINDCEQAKLR